MMKMTGIRYRRGDEPIKPQKDWKLPNPPEGYITPVAFYYDDGEVVLDWTTDRIGGPFSSEDPALEGQGEISWPFDAGQTPNVEDWTDIGITPLW